ncbi:MAG TPA: methyltransferase domain-containing protein [Planctomycetaceae bacterium]|nr:methyltransferase domain-containing protein [Planctomycetaceae bacterium]
MSSRQKAYNDDLAWIHDTGFGQFATNAAVELLSGLRRAGLRSGTIVDLGCGSGILAEAMARHGYAIVGFDQSAAMVALSQRRVPAGDFRQASFLDAEIPPCVAVTAIGEVFNYLFDRRNTPARLRMLFRRIHQSLRLDGLFLFDVATPGRVPGGYRRSYVQGDDWACLFTAEEDVRHRNLTRTITSFRKAGELYRRDDEVHRLRLYAPDTLKSMLRGSGFRVRTIRRYAELAFPPGYAGFVARRD